MSSPGWEPKELLAEELRGAWDASKRYSSDMAEPPTGRRDGFVYGLVQPFLAVKLVRRHPELIRLSLVPVLWTTAVAVAWAWIDADNIKEAFFSFLEAIALLSALPGLFSRHLARLAARAHALLGFGEAEPKILSLRRAVREFITQGLLIALVSAPLFAVLRMMGPPGRALGFLVNLAWVMHWVVVNSLGEARVLKPGETLADADREDAAIRPPWFLRMLRTVLEKIPFMRRMLMRILTRMEKWSIPMREELAIVEAHPVLCAGFGVSSSILLAIPGVNFCLRPLTLVAAVHLLGQLERREARERSGGIIEARKVTGAVGDEEPTVMADTDPTESNDLDATRNERGGPAPRA